MKLTAWLTETGTTQEAFGRRIGVTQGRVSQIALNGTDSIKIAAVIESETDGKVTIRDVMRTEAVE